MLKRAVLTFLALLALCGVVVAAISFSTACVSEAGQQDADAYKRPQEPNPRYQRVFTTMGCGVRILGGAVVDHSDEISAAVTAIATIFIALYTFALSDSTRALRDAAEQQKLDMLESLRIAGVAADAAKQSADHIPIVERAYVFATPVPWIKDNTTVTYLRIENFGQTPGFLIEAHGCTSDIEPTGVPTYFGSPRFIEAIVKKGTADPFPTNWVSPFTTPHYFFGYIKYTDIFKKGHISRVCKRILPAEGKIDMAGPPARNEWD
jgi:hypothetical protein